jgi:putative addiction module antidote
LIAETVITIVVTEVKIMVTLKIRKVGNSLGLVLPKEVISRLRTGEGDDVFLLEGPNNTYRLTPFDPSFQRKMEKAEEIMARYRNTLHRLAE